MLISRRRLPFTLAGVTLMCCVLFTGCTGNLFYMPRPYRQQHLDLLDRPEVTQLHYKVNGYNQTAFFIKGRSSGRQRGVWLLLGGINSLALDWHQWFYREESDCSFLLLDYPGYGLNKGIPRARYISQGGRAAISALADYLNTSVENVTSRLGVLGHSLGTGAALDLTSQLPVKRLILVAPFTSLKELVVHRYGMVQGTFLNIINPEKYPNLERLSSIINRSPSPEIFIIHGAEDSVIPPRMGRQLAELSPEKIAYIEVDNLGHQEVFAEKIDLITALMDMDMEEK